jgi:amphi-Trp domain-containing protein
MADSDGEFLHESLQDRKSIKALLEALTKAIAKGEVTLSDEDDELKLPLDRLLHLRIKASRSEGKCVVGMRLSWTEEQKFSKEKSKPSIQ